MTRDLKKDENFLFCLVASYLDKADCKQHRKEESQESKSQDASTGTAPTSVPLRSEHLHSSIHAGKSSSKSKKNGERLETEISLEEISSLSNQIKCKRPGSKSH